MFQGKNRLPKERVDCNQSEASSYQELKLSAEPWARPGGMEELMENEKNCFFFEKGGGGLCGIQLKLSERGHYRTH